MELLGLDRVPAEQLKDRSQDALASLYCERMTDAVAPNVQRPQPHEVVTAVVLISGIGVRVKHVYRKPIESGRTRKEILYVSGFGFGQDELEAERTALCGERYAHQVDRQAVRAGAELAGVGGRQIEIRRPRARSSDGHELRLPSWQAWSSHDPLDEG